METQQRENAVIEDKRWGTTAVWVLALSILLLIILGSLYAVVFIEPECPNGLGWCDAPVDSQLRS